MRTILLTLAILMPVVQTDTPAENPYTRLMRQASAHAAEHHALTPALSPNDAGILSSDPEDSIPVAALQAMGIRVIPWTTNDPEKMRTIIRAGVDGLISDYPDRLQKVLAEERAANPGKYTTFDVQGHRGGRGLRPENTLPSFENGMDLGITSIETDTGVTADGVSLIWHDQFLNPQSCRRAPVNGVAKPYTLADRVYIQDITLKQAQTTYICDRIHTGTPFAATQQNDLVLSPVAVAFAKSQGLISPYVPTHAEQLFHFAAFYADYYRIGPGRRHPQAAARAHTGATVHFNLETKIIPRNLPKSLTDELAPGVPAEFLVNHTVSPQAFVDALCGAIVRNKMQSRADIQSFDFRTLQLVEAQYPDILTVYLTEPNPKLLTTEYLPESLRQ